MNELIEWICSPVASYAAPQTRGPLVVLWNEDVGRRVMATNFSLKLEFPAASLHWFPKGPSTLNLFFFFVESAFQEKGERSII